MSSMMQDNTTVEMTSKVETANKIDTGRDMNLEQDHTNQKLFVPFSEDLLAAAGSPLGELVPFQLEYQCVRLLDGTFEFTTHESPAAGHHQAALQSGPGLVHAA